MELRQGAKRPQCNSDFMNKIEERSNTAHPPSPKKKKKKKKKKCALLFFF